MPSQDPGEIQNRLSLDPSNPNWRDFVGSWEDGQEYTLTVKVRQVSPGEFEVTSATPQETPTEDTGETGETMNEGGSEYGGGDMNPAVAKMMAGKKS